MPSLLSQTHACLVRSAASPVPLPSRSDFAKMTPLEKARWAARCMMDFQQVRGWGLRGWGLRSLQSLNPKPCAGPPLSPPCMQLPQPSHARRGGSSGGGSNDKGLSRSEAGRKGELASGSDMLRGMMLRDLALLQELVDSPAEGGESVAAAMAAKVRGAPMSHKAWAGGGNEGRVSPPASTPPPSLSFLSTSSAGDRDG